MYVISSDCCTMYHLYEPREQSYIHACISSLPSQPLSSCHPSVSSPWLWPGDPPAFWRTQWNQQPLAPFIVPAYFISYSSHEPVPSCSVKSQPYTWESMSVQPQTWSGSPGDQYPHPSLLLSRPSPPEWAVEPQGHSRRNPLNCQPGSRSHQQGTQGRIMPSPFTQCVELEGFQERQ